jgi:glycosyltransferase involved in cell wall biosynthesis
MQPMFNNKGHSSDLINISIIIPVCDEAGNIPYLFEQLPDFGFKTEFIFVEGHSRDKSDLVIKAYIDKHDELDCRLLKQPGIGKADAVFHGLNCSLGEILMIFDADLTISPEVLCQILGVINSKEGVFITGNRFHFPVERQAMPFFNYLGNMLFSNLLSILIGKRLNDTLCGIKGFRKADYLQMMEKLNSLMPHDPYSDFFLIFGASYLGLDIIEIPVRYKKRDYGISKINPFIDGLKLLRFLLFIVRTRFYLRK